MSTDAPEPIPSGPNASSRLRRLTTDLVVWAVGAGLMLSAYGWIATTDGVPGNDSYYHLKMAEMLPDVGLVNDFPWLRFAYFTDEGHAFISHHYGFHVLLAPFVRVSRWITGEDFAGGRWVIASCFGLILVLFARLVRDRGAGGLSLWLPLFTLLPFQFFTRHAFIRAIAPSLMFMLLLLLALFHRRAKTAALVVALYIHLYMGGVLYAPLIVVAYVVSELFTGSTDRRALLRITAWSVAGWIGGILTHPYRHGMIEFLRLQVFGSGLSPDIPVGKEWKPYADLWWFTQMSGVLIAVWLIAVIARLRHGARLTGPELCLLLLNIAFGVLTAKARRFIEYWPMFCLLSAAYLASPWLADWGRWLAERISRRKLRRTGLVAGLAATVIIVMLSPMWREIRSSSRCDYDLPAIRAAMTYLQENSAPGDVVFTDDWDIFPLFFYFNAHNHYIVGLDPKFTHARDPELWERYVKISRGQTPSDLTVDVKLADGAFQRKRIHVELTDIREQFGAQWVVTDRDHAPLAKQLAAAADFTQLVYPAKRYEEAKDQPYLVLRVAPH